MLEMVVVLKKTVRISSAQTLFLRTNGEERAMT